MKHLPDSIYIIIDFECTGLTSDPCAIPIEIGALACDRGLNILGLYSSLIRHPGTDPLQDWPAENANAARIHKITPAQLRQEGKEAQVVVLELLEFIEACKKDFSQRCVLVSDNTPFELEFLKRLYEAAGLDFKSPFYYHAWDVYYLFKLAGLPSVGVGEKPHRAMGDCQLIYKSLVRAFERLKIGLGKFLESKE